jgi:hypothetical protein
MKLWQWSEMYKSFWLTCLLVVGAHAQTIPPGAYQMGGYGWLNISPVDEQGYQKFDISTFGANAHICDLDGRIRKGLAQLDYNSKHPEDRCDIRFTTPKRGVVEVVPVAEYHGGCRNYCGMRASFDGEYALPPKKCSTVQFKTITKQFSQKYKSRDYKGAANLLEMIYPACESWLFFTDRIDIRNDLAITYHHLRRPADCIRILQPFIDLGIQRSGATERDGMSFLHDEDLASELALDQPAYMEWAKGATQSARTNLRLCGYKFPTKQP